MPIPKPSSDNYGSPSDAGIMGEDYRLDQARFQEAPPAKVIRQRMQRLLDAGWKHDRLWTHSMVAGEHNFSAAEMHQQTLGMLVTPKRSKPYIDDDTAEPEGAPE